MVFLMKLLQSDYPSEELKSLFLLSVFRKTVLEGIFNYGTSLAHASVLFHLRYCYYSTHRRTSKVSLIIVISS